MLPGTAPALAPRLLSVPTSSEDESAQTAREEVRANGFAVFADVLTPDEVAASVENLWDSAELLQRKSSAVNRNDPVTWRNDHWPSAAAGKGFVEAARPLTDTQAFRNRQNPRVVSCFRALLGTDEIWVSLDRYGVMRPTRNAASREPEAEDWATEASWLHFDRNPLVTPNVEEEAKEEGELNPIQGMLMLTDHTEESGGFCCVPAFHKDWAEYCARIRRAGEPLNQSRAQTPFFLSPTTEGALFERVRRILPIPAGSLLIWDSRLPHQNFPNTSETELRMVQYVTFRPVPDDDEAQLLRRNWELKKRAGIVTRELLEALTPLGRLITGYREYGRETGSDDDDAVEVSADGAEALRLIEEASEREAAGEMQEAVRLYRRAYRLNPALEEIA
jgi:Phytanoyl-CoA dioxygenase (PhyH)